MIRVRLACAAVVLSLGASWANAQQATPRYLESRVDALTGRGTAVEGGAGVVLPMGTYVRFAVDGAAGVTWRDDAARTSGRVDLVSRFLLDPFREMPVGLSVGGGVSVPYVQGDKRVRPYLTAVIDLEGRKHGPVTPALQIGLGGGARVGVVFRTSPTSRR